MAGIVMVVWSSLEQPHVRVERHWLSNKALRNIEHIAPKASNGTMLCPCLYNNAVSFPQQIYIPFNMYLITQNSDGVSYQRHLEITSNDSLSPTSKDFLHPFSSDLCASFLPRQSPFTNVTQPYCDDLNDAIAKYLLLQVVNLPTLNPRLFLNRACAGMAAVSDDVYNRFNPREKINNATTEERVSFFIAEMWFQMLWFCSVWAAWPPPQDADYWGMIHDGPHKDSFLNYSLQAARVKLSINRTVAFGMDVNWTFYYEICNPSYCDEIIALSLPASVYIAVAQVGGFLSLSMVTLRIVLWPLVQAMAGWKNEPPRSLLIP